MSISKDDIQREIDSLYPIGARVFIGRDVTTKDPVLEIVSWDRYVNIIFQDRHLSRPIAEFRDKWLAPAIAYMVKK